MFFLKDCKLKLVESLPEGIHVRHTPQAVGARRGGRSGYQYTWLFQTHVGTLDEAIKVEEFGAFDWFWGKWRFSNHTGRPFTTEDFADWYSCPNGILLPGRIYTDPTNWNGSEGLAQAKSLCYFIGTNSHGVRVKGTSQIVCLAEIGDFADSDSDA